MPPHDAERLRHLVALGDPDALQQLLTEATRRDDTALRYAATTAAVAAAREAIGERAPSRALDLLARLPPSDGAWRALCDLLPHLNPTRQAQALPDLCALLDARWPDDLRAADTRWAPPAHPALHAARALRLHGVTLPGAEAAPYLPPSDALHDAPPDDLPAMRWHSLAFSGLIIDGTDRAADALATLLRAPAAADLHRLRVQSPALRAHLGALVRDLPQAPALTHLALSGCRLTADVTEPLLRHARLRALTHLDLSSNHLTGPALADLLSSPHLTALEALDLRDNTDLGDDAGDRFAHAPHLPCASLRDLSLGGCGLHDDSLGALTTCAHLTALEVLDLSHNSINQAGARALSRARTLPRLQALSLAHNNLRDGGLMALAHWPGLHAVRLLDLSHNHLQYPALSELAASRHANHLQALHLRDNPLGDRALQAFSRPQHLTALHTLDLRRCALTDRGALSLLTSPLGRRLRALSLGNDAPAPPFASAASAPITASTTTNRLSLDLATHIARLPADALPHLSHLSLALTHLTDAGAAALAAAPALASLTSLDLRGCGLSSVGAIALLTSPYLTRLTRLALRGNALGDDLAHLLCASASLPPLLDLDADLADFSPKGAATLRASPPLHPDLCASLGLSPFTAAAFNGS